MERFKDNLQSIIITFLTGGAGKVADALELTEWILRLVAFPLAEEFSEQLGMYPYVQLTYWAFVDWGQPDKITANLPVRI